MKILIDARLYGLENAGLGRYLINLVSELSKFDSKNEYVLLLRKKYFDNLSLPTNWKKVLADFHHYSFKEQIFLPGLINKENPDLVHFPHFNVPIFFRGKYIVTIHDMLMHQFTGLSATTLPAPFYCLKQTVYKFVFAMAVGRAVKVIVPSETVKNDLISHYKINSKKVEVIYEG
jgi:glycosyltransferase involved in cell wall biosynthesis